MTELKEKGVLHTGSRKKKNSTNVHSNSTTNTSINLDGRVDLVDKFTGAQVANGATHDPQSEAEQGHVAKVEAGLEEAVHSVERKLGVTGCVVSVVW